ncbi:MAG: preprotein translocase subunit SecE [Polyangiaceae bacterium]|jgi:preprotein translocase subunit SecE|nr:preprotein translocase subunit SecE [Polyangiaceae bacterium]
MGRVDDTKTNEELQDAEQAASVEVSEPREVVRVGEDVAQGVAPTQLGATRYVMAGFFAATIAVAYVFGRTVSATWNYLADAQWAVDKAPWLTSVGEDARGTYGTLAGGVIALALLLYVYRREDIRTWVNEAAAELAKVSWPNKKEVTNGTVVVIIASIIATIYFMLLDRFWGFVTDLVYRA